MYANGLKYGVAARVLANLEKMMRKDVVYLIVASELIKHNLSKFNVLLFSSKGDPNSQMTLPHLYSYQSPGFDLNGKPLYNLEHPVHPQSGLCRETTFFFLSRSDLTFYVLHVMEQV
jgi:hypothetical protein